MTYIRAVGERAIADWLTAVSVAGGREEDARNDFPTVYNAAIIAREYLDLLARHEKVLEAVREAIYHLRRGSPDLPLSILADRLCAAFGLGGG